MPCFFAAAKSSARFAPQKAVVERRQHDIEFSGLDNVRHFRRLSCHPNP
jgi:hypothetical protein